MRDIFVTILVFASIIVVANSQYTKFQNYNDRNLSDKPRLIGEFLLDEIAIIPGEQLYKAQDAWEQAGAKKIKVSEPKQKATSKDFIKNIIIEDASKADDRFLKVTYNGKNETITAINLVTDLTNGDYFRDKFYDLNGQYEPSSSSKKGIESMGTYYFDDFFIKVTEKSNETIELYITKNPKYLKRKKIK